jgi:LysM repeat protein
MAAPSRARYLAPVALVAAIAGTYVIVHSALSDKQATQSQTVVAPPRPHGRYAKKKFYVVRPGDNLTRIAARTGVPLTTLEALNQRIDPNSLQTGQRLRLRR